MLSGNSYVLLDFSNLCYIAFFASYKEDMNRIPMGYNNHITYFEKIVQNIRRWNGLAEFVYALDSKPTEKYELYPEYKGNRKNRLTHASGDSFDVKTPILEALKQDPVTHFIRKEGYEADDVIASFIAQNIEHEVVCVTTDKDIWAVGNHPNVRIYDPVKKDFIGPNNLRESFCRKDKHKVIHQHLTDYSQIRLWKSLWGDSGDNIKNVVPRTQKDLMPIMAASDGTLEDFYERIETSEISEKCRLKLEQAKEAIALNDKLVRLKYNLDYEKC